MSGTVRDLAKPSSGLSAEIVTTGTEILLGEIVDTNAAWIAQQLRDAGINLYFKTTVGDNESRVRSVIELGLSRSDVIIVSGGLGPTADDITRHAIAAATQRPLCLDESALDTLKIRFSRFGVRMTDNNRQQALIPQDAILIENPVGTAPGFIVESARGTVIAIPGVPREMKHLMSESVLPYLRDRAGNTGTIRRRVLRTMGIGESTLDDALGELMLSANPTIGLAAHTGQADVRVTARADTVAEADEMMDQMETQICQRVGMYIYSRTPDESFEAVVVGALRDLSVSVSIVETNTQGAIGRRLSMALPNYDPLCEQWVLGGDRAAPQPIRNVAANVDGALQYQEDQAREMAKLLNMETDAAYGLAILGSSGADEGVYGSENGRTWVGIASSTRLRSVLCPYGGRDEHTIVRISNQALGLLWDFLKENTLTFLNRANELKRLPRMGWILAGVSRPESVAEHTCSTTMLAVVLAELINCDFPAQGLEQMLDTGRVTRIALFHDLAESVVTDLPKRAKELIGAAVKREAEREAVRSIFDGLPAAGKYGLLWDEYAETSSPEARVVRDADKLEMVHQALQYEQRGHKTLADFWEGHSWHFPVSRSLFAALVAARSE